MVSKKYVRDHLVLLLLSINAFLAIAVLVLVLTRLASTHSSSYIVQCRDCSNVNAIKKFKPGSISDLLGFIVFALLTLVTTTFMSMRAYRIHRQLAIAILSLGVLLGVITIIVSNSVLALR